MYIILLFIFMMLSACQPMHSHSKEAYNKPPIKRSQSIEKDGPPPISHLFSFNFRAIIPKVEALSRYGNPASYKVEGHRYQVLRSAKGYKTRGIASWYGAKFHKRRTSSGDHYDMFAMTAAHKTLPLPSYVKVKNLRNGKEAIVKVNDRGPFRSNRIIDLSYAAASKLGMLPQGTAPVEVEAITPGNQSKTVAHYYVQAGAFSTRQSAAALQKRIKKLAKAPVFIERVQKHFIVKVGPFEAKKRTEQLTATLKSKGIKGVFTRLG